MNILFLNACFGNWAIIFGFVLKIKQVVFDVFSIKLFYSAYSVDFHKPLKRNFVLIEYRLYSHYNLHILKILINLLVSM